MGSLNAVVLKAAGFAAVGRRILGSGLAEAFILLVHSADLPLIMPIHVAGMVVVEVYHKVLVFRSALEGQFLM